jgi:outer membrane protein assembly factor BamB
MTTARNPARRRRAAVATATTLTLVIATAVVGPGRAVAAPAGPSAPARPPAVTAATGLEPQLVTSFDTSAAGGGARALLGDVTGDGRLDLVLMQPTFSADDRFIGRQVQALTAYDIGTGTLLWQIGTPDPRVTNNGTDIPAEIYDLDGDGDNDVLAIMDSQFRVFDGATGAFVRAFPLPHPEAHDTLIIANLRGTDRPADIVLKDRYNQIWALDSEGNQLWTFRGTPGHRPYPHDFDDDGRQELIGGYDFLTADGAHVWTADMADHPDSIAVGDIDGDGAEDITFGGAGLGGDSTNAYRSDGTLLWRNLDAVEAQQVGLGDFRPDLPGLEVAGLDRVDRTPANAQDSLYLVSSTGQTLWKEQRPTRGCFGTVMEPLHNWDGTYSDMLLAWNRGCGEIAGIWDGFGNRVATFPVDGRMVRGDICGDDRGEVLTYVMGVAAHVFANDATCDLNAKVTGRPLPQAKKLYNYTRYTAEEIPADLALGRRWVPSVERGRLVWTVDLGRVRELTGITVDFLLRLPRTGFRVQTSIDRREWVTVTERAYDPDDVQRAEFTGLGRYVRIAPERGVGVILLTDVAVLGTV